MRLWLPVAILLVWLGMALGAQLLPLAPNVIDLPQILAAPGEGAWLGHDDLGRQIADRLIIGARTSLLVSVWVVGLSLLAGTLFGTATAYHGGWWDKLAVQLVDTFLAFPGILLAIALISLSGATLVTVVIAIVIPEIPRVVRLVRSVVLSVREEPYVEAAIASGTRLVPILWRHILPNTIAPLIVQATYICGSAMLTEAILGFLGAGIPPEIPSWGNIMSEGRTYFQLTPWIIFYPGIALALTVLAVNTVGDGLRDTLDPRIARKM